MKNTWHHKCIKSIMNGFICKRIYNVLSSSQYMYVHTTHPRHTTFPNSFQVIVRTYILPLPMAPVKPSNPVKENMWSTEPNNNRYLRQEGHTTGHGSHRRSGCLPGATCCTFMPWLKSGFLSVFSLFFCQVAVSYRPCRESRLLVGYIYALMHQCLCLKERNKAKLTRSSHPP